MSFSWKSLFNINNQDSLGSPGRKSGFGAKAQGGNRPGTSTALNTNPARTDATENTVSDKEILQSDGDIPPAPSSPSGASAQPAQPIVHVVTPRRMWSTQESPPDTLSPISAISIGSPVRRTAPPAAPHGKQWSPTEWNCWSHDDGRTVYESDARIALLGIDNFGNSCYLNSVLQALFHCHPFRDAVLGQEFQIGQSDASEDDTLLCSLKQLFDAMAHNATQVYMNPSIATITKMPTMLNKTSKTPVILGKSVDQDAIKSFLVTLQRNCDLFDSSMHHDAHEFLIFTLNRIGEDLTAQAERNKGERAAGTPSMGKHVVPRTYVHRLFQGILTNETRCLTCESISNRDEEFLDLSINVAPFTSVSSCLRKFSESEMLSGRNKFFCDTCASLQEAEKRIKIRHLPDILALHLKRFGWDESAQAYIKNACRVVFPLDLRLFNASNQANNPDREYELFGIVVHVGAGAHQGHYISVIRVGPRWVLFDDELAETIPESEIAKFYGDSPETGSAYVLFYRALDMDNSAGKSSFVPKNGTSVSAHTSSAPHIVPLTNSSPLAHKSPELTSVLSTSPLSDPLPAPALAVSAAPKPMLVQPTHAVLRPDELDEHTIPIHETLPEDASNDRQMQQSQVPSRRPWLGRSRFSRRRS